MRESVSRPGAAVRAATSLTLVSVVLLGCGAVVEYAGSHSGSAAVASPPKVAATTQAAQTSKPPTPDVSERHVPRTESVSLPPWPRTPSASSSPTQSVQLSGEH